MADARYLHRRTQHPAAGLVHLPTRALDVINRDDERRMLRRLVGLSRVETTIDCTRSPGTALIGVSRHRKDVIVHLLTKHPGLPSKGLAVKFRHALAIVVRHFEVNDGVHLDHARILTNGFADIALTRGRTLQRHPDITPKISSGGVRFLAPHRGVIAVIQDRSGLLP